MQPDTQFKRFGWLIYAIEIMEIKCTSVQYSWKYKVMLVGRYRYIITIIIIACLFPHFNMNRTHTSDYPLRQSYSKNLELVLSTKRSERI